MTGDASALHNPQPYHNPNSVQLGNGDSLHITSTGTIPISLYFAPFYLRIVFLVPSLRKNLLSVARFTYDNNVAICFFPHFYIIYDLRTGCFRTHVKMAFIHCRFRLLKPSLCLRPLFGINVSVTHLRLFCLVFVHI